MIKSTEYLAMKILLVNAASSLRVTVVTELQSDLERFLVSERVKIQDECSLQAVNKVISASSGKKDRVQQMIDSWTGAFQQVKHSINTLAFIKNICC